MISKENRRLGCAECAAACDLGFDFTMAFQPIVNMLNKTIYSQEALVRGLNQEGAFHILQNVNQTNRYRFDQSCRVKAIKLAAELNVQEDSLLSINFLPNAVYRPEFCIQTTLKAAELYQFPKEKIIFEFTENEQVIDSKHLKSIIDNYKDQGFLTAMDDFGAGFNGLSQLADLQTDIAKIDITLVKNIHQDKTKQTIVRHLINLFNELNILIIAEGIETQAEHHTLEDMGIHLFQGYYFAKPSFESLAEVNWG